MVVACILSACQSDPSSRKSFPIRASEISGEWEGLTEDGVFYIVQLEPSGMGAIGYARHDESAAILGVSSWRCDGKRLFVSAGQGEADPNAAIRIEGQAGWLKMDLNVPGRNWHRHLTHYRVSEWKRLSTAVRTGASPNVRAAAEPQSPKPSKRTGSSPPPFAPKTSS
jgi:hypothetical protein